MQPSPYQITATAGGCTVQVDAIHQPSDPDQPGEVAMDRARAIAVAKLFAIRLGYDLAAIGEPVEVG